MTDVVDLKSPDMVTFEKYRAARQRLDEEVTLDNMRACRAAFFEFFDLYVGPMSSDQAKASLKAALEFRAPK